MLRMVESRLDIINIIIASLYFKKIECYYFSISDDIDLTRKLVLLL